MSWTELAKSYEINKAIFQLMTGIELNGLAGQHTETEFEPVR
jgi:hypothetical protein